MGVGLVQLLATDDHLDVGYGEPFIQVDASPGWPERRVVRYHVQSVGQIVRCAENAHNDFSGILLFSEQRQGKGTAH